MRVLFSFIPFFFIMVLSISFSILSKRKVGVCFPLTIIVITFAMYGSQYMFGTFKIAYHLILIAAVLGISWIIYLIILNKGMHFFSIGFISFSLIFFLFVVIDYKRSFSLFDEYYHWGMMVKEQLRLDSFYSVNESNLWIHKDYPPFVPLFQTFWCKFSNGYSEMNVSVAMHVMALSFVCPQISESIVNNKKTNLLFSALIAFSTIIAIFLLMLFFDGWTPKVSSSILNDVFIGLLFGAIIIHIIRSDFSHVFDWFYLASLYCFIIMTKQVGISFILVGSFLQVLRIILLDNYKYRRYKSILFLILILVLPLLLYYSWNNYIEHFSIWKQFDLSKIDFKQYIDTFLLPDDSLKHKTLSNFIKAIFDKQINLNAVFPLTFFSSQVLVGALCYLLSKRKPKESFILCFTLILGSLGYAFMMSILYLFTFNEIEMTNLASYERYMDSYVLGEIVGIFAVFLQNDSQKINHQVKIICFYVCLLLVLAPSNCYYLVPEYFRKNNDKTYENDGKILNRIIPKESNVLVIYDGNRVGPSWYGAYQVYLTYYCPDKKIFHQDLDIFTWNMNIESFQNQLINDMKMNDYLFIRDTNESLTDFLIQQTNLEAVNNYSLYKISFDEKTIFLQEELLLH